MDSLLSADRNQIVTLLKQVTEYAAKFLQTLPARKVAGRPTPQGLHSLPVRGMGAESALALFRRVFEPDLSGSAGPRYFGFVTGGTTPAALAADWLVGTYDQNTSNVIGSSAGIVELEALELLKQLFHLPAEFAGCFVTGATMANFAGLATARQWVGEQLGRDIAEEGLSGLPPLRVLSATPHVSATKALAMLGIGRKAIDLVPTLPGREAMDVDLLERKLAEESEVPPIVLASACTVNTADFDDLETIARLCGQYKAWLHVDAAFGLFAACSPATAPLVRGIHHADSIASDGHKWLNVPYDCGFHFTRHIELQEKVFRATAPYLVAANAATPDMLNRTPENSQRFRALPVWMTLMAYGHDGYQDIVERNCRFARDLGDWLDQSPYFELLAPVRLNIVCFALSRETMHQSSEASATNQFIETVNRNGKTFLTPTTYAGRPAIRAAISNWSTTQDDFGIVAAALREAVKGLLSERLDIRGVADWSK